MTERVLRLLPTESSSRLCSDPPFLEASVMPSSPPSPDVRCIADNLRRTVELTELGLALRRDLIEQRNGAGAGEGIAQVMHEIRLAKEQA